MRVHIGKAYREASFRYVMEALTEYIEEKEAKRVGGRISRTWPECLLDARNGAGGLPQLWWDAVQWGKGKKTFRQWWVRAALARGHAEWLENEPYIRYCKVPPIFICSSYALP
jgi:hypothetical protein